MRNLTLDEFNTLTLNSTVLADDEHGKKVLELTDHSIIKLFRVKRLISQATIYSPARRFAKNARKLQQLNIPTITLIDLYNFKDIKRTAVHYQQLEGVTVREHLQENSADEFFLAELGKFLAEIHAKGVFFRSAHFGNIIYTPEKKFGLIDISDMSISRYSLDIVRRLRNLKHIFRISEDIGFVQHCQVIEKSYLTHCNIKSNFFKQKFLQITQNLKEKNR